MAFESKVEAVIPSGQASEMGLTGEAAVSKPYQYLTFRGRLFASSGGLVVGMVKPSA
jgi:hypothetical protein